MSQNLINKIKEAVNESKKWAEKGWEMSFGPRETPVNSLKIAEDLPETHSFKLEAVAYWRRVEKAGQENAEYGEKAIKALAKGDDRACNDAIYYIQFLEKIYEKQTHTWKTVFDELKQANGLKA